MTWTIVYRDGSANAYRFAAAGEGATFSYDPVTPERSSTGMYSGGDPRSGELSPAVSAELWQRVRALEANTALHVADRGKGTGAFGIDESSGNRTFIIARGPELVAFDAFVAAL